MRGWSMRHDVTEVQKKISDAFFMARQVYRSIPPRHRHTYGLARYRGDPMTPESEYSPAFWEAMKRRMGVSYHKYGPVASSFGDNLQNIRVRIGKYIETGNAEFLVDVANFAMMEFLHPNHENAHFRATDDDESPGLVILGSSRPRKNTDNQGNRQVR